MRRLARLAALLGAIMVVAVGVHYAAISVAKGQNSGSKIAIQTCPACHGKSLAD